jgi:hypothetical protein
MPPFNYIPLAVLQLYSSFFKPRGFYYHAQRCRILDHEVAPDIAWFLKYQVVSKKKSETKNKKMPHIRENLGLTWDKTRSFLVNLKRRINFGFREKLDKREIFRQKKYLFPSIWRLINSQPPNSISFFVIQIREWHPSKGSLKRIKVESGWDLAECGRDLAQHG